MADINYLRTRSNQQLREMGRIPYPFVYRKGDRGFSRVTWEKALELIGKRLSKFHPQRQGYFATSKGLTNETYYTFTKTARLMWDQQCRLLCVVCTCCNRGRSKSNNWCWGSNNFLIGFNRNRFDFAVGNHLANNQPVSVKYLHHAKKQVLELFLSTLSMKKVSKLLDTSFPNQLFLDPNSQMSL